MDITVEGVLGVSEEDVLICQLRCERHTLSRTTVISSLPLAKIKRSQVR